MAKPKKSIKTTSSQRTKTTGKRKNIIFEAKKRKKTKVEPQIYGYEKFGAVFKAKRGLRVGGEKVRSSKTKIVGRALKPSPISIGELDPGAIIRFKYRGPTAHDPSPVVLVLNNSFQGHMHAINLRYVPSDIYPALQEFVVGESIEDQHPKTFYDSKLKSFINNKLESRGIAAYRTYSVKKISNVKIYTVTMEEIEY